MMTQDQVSECSDHSEDEGNTEYSSFTGWRILMFLCSAIAIVVLGSIEI